MNRTVRSPGRVSAGSPIAALGGTPARRFLYLPVRTKFALALCLALAWTGLSIWLSLRWLNDLAAVAGLAFALVAIGFIAWVPGFMNAFLIATLLLDRKPRRKEIAEYPPLTVLVAAYNEAQGISDTLVSLARQDYPGTLEVLILNDGSTDDTAAIVRRLLGKLPVPINARFRLLDFSINRGKAIALNDGLHAAAHELIVTLDGDCWLRANGLSRIVARLLSDPEGTTAIAGAVMVRNSRVNLLTRAQEWDYFHGIAAVKRMQAMYHGTLVAQGAFSLYRRDALLEVGGWPDCVGEDIVVSWALLERGHRIGYAADAFAFTNVPERVRQFALQRKRWSRGLACFGYFYIAGPLTLAVLPLAAAWNAAIFRIQRKVFHGEDLRIRRNLSGFPFYALAYSLLMQPVCVWGYFAELLGMRKAWDTK